MSFYANLNQLLCIIFFLMPFFQAKKLKTNCQIDKRPYSKSLLELESNSSEILPVNCRFILVLRQL